MYNRELQQEKNKHIIEWIMGHLYDTGVSMAIDADSDQENETYQEYQLGIDMDFQAMELIIRLIGPSQVIDAIVRNGDLEETCQINRELTGQPYDEEYCEIWTAIK